MEIIATSVFLSNLFDLFGIHFFRNLLQQQFCLDKTAKNTIN